MILKTTADSKKLAALKTDSARLVWHMVYPHLDVEGRIYGDARYLNSHCMTRLEKTDEQMEEWLADLVRVRLVIAYEANGDKIIEFTNFKKCQPKLRPDHEAPPLPPMPPPQNTPKAEPKRKQKGDADVPF